jgi:hypothetical protein
MSDAKLAWNGVSLVVPGLWEPAAIERRYLRLEERGMPRADIQWRRVRGPFDAGRHVRRLAKRFRRDEVRMVEPEGPWLRPFERLRESGLAAAHVQWQGGCGGVVHNPATGLAATLQFHDLADHSGSVDIAAGVLASFRDHWAGATLPWRMFGMRARTPSDFLLHGFSFMPGKSLVTLRRPKRMPAVDAPDRDIGRGPGVLLELERLVPADVVLGDRPVSLWAAEYCSERIQGETREQGQGIAWNSLRKRFLRRPVLSMGRIWHDASRNALLGVYGSGDIPLDNHQFDEVCAQYGAV